MKIALGTHTMIGYPPVIKRIPSSKKRKRIFKWAKKKEIELPEDEQSVQELLTNYMKYQNGVGPINKYKTMADY